MPMRHGTVKSIILKDTVMAHQHTPAPISEEELARSRANWTNFTKLTKVSVIATILLLAAMAFFLV